MNENEQTAIIRENWQMPKVFKKVLLLGFVIILVWFGYIQWRAVKLANQPFLVELVQIDPARQAETPVGYIIFETNERYNQEKLSADKVPLEDVSTSTSNDVGEDSVEESNINRPIIMIRELANADVTDMPLQYHEGQTFYIDTATWTYTGGATIVKNDGVTEVPHTVIGQEVTLSSSTLMVSSYDGQHLFVANKGESTLSVFKVGEVDQSLTLVYATYTNLGKVISLQSAPNSQHVVIASVNKGGVFLSYYSADNPAVLTQTQLTTKPVTFKLVKWQTEDPRLNLDPDQVIFDAITS